MDQFVCVRLVKANAIDLTLFQFDYDLTFAVVFMNADGTTYGRYGSRSEFKEAEKDISIDGFARALSGALHLHKRYPDNKSFLEGKQPRPTGYESPDDYPALRGKYKPKLDYAGQVVKSCMHCHQIRDAARAVYRDAGKPIPDKLLFPYPMPEVVGLSLDPKQRATVKSVQPDSAAADAGFQVGDKILTLNRQAILSTADVQWVLENVEDEDEIKALIERGGKTEFLRLTLDKGWRRATDISWRVSSWPLRRMGTGGLTFDSLTAAERRSAELNDSQLALRVNHVGQYGAHAAAKRAGFRKGDIVVSFDGKTDAMTNSQLLAYAAQNTKPGQRVPVTVLRGGKRLNLNLPMQK